MWDDDILCAACDGKLGDLENYAHKVFEAIRETGSEQAGKWEFVEEVDNDKLVRFCAGILYKYSLTKLKLGQISIGKYQQICREVALREVPIPNCLDVFMFRPVRQPLDNGAFAYRTPLWDRKYGVNMYRMMLGGMLIFTKVDQRELRDSSIVGRTLRFNMGMPYMTIPANVLEEFTGAQEVIAANPRLSTFLERVEREKPLT